MIVQMWDLLIKNKKNRSKKYFHVSDWYQKEIDWLIYFSPMVCFYIFLWRRNKREDLAWRQAEETCQSCIFNACWEQAEAQSSIVNACWSHTGWCQFFFVYVVVKADHCHGAVIIVIVVKALLQCHHWWCLKM